MKVWERKETERVVGTVLGTSMVHGCKNKYIFLIKNNLCYRELFIAAWIVMNK